VHVPDGVLWRVPFQALQSAASRHLIEDHTIFYAHSLGVARDDAAATAAAQPRYHILLIRVNARCSPSPAVSARKR